MWRVLVYLAIVAALAAGAIWLSDQPGRVAFVWDGTSYSVGLALAAILLVLAVAALLILEAIVRFLLGLPERFSEATVGRKRRKGLIALSRGMVAVGSGDEAAARRYARDAQRYLKADEPLVLLLRAQAAQIAGDHADASAAFEAMTQADDTRVLGLRGLYVEARRRGDREAAYAHAREATTLAPAVNWANEAVLESYVAKGDWRAALDMVEKRAALGLVDKQTSRRQRAVLITADALSRGEVDEDAALERAKEAVRLAPDLVPAAALAGRILARRLEFRKAAKIVEAAWKHTPHPDLADVYTHLRSGDSTHDRMERAEKLATLSTWSLEGRLALARAALEAREFKKARETLGALVNERPTVRVCLLMAEIERAEHGSGVAVREWLARAVHAPRDRAWVADGVVSDRWAPISPVTGRLDAFEWREPPETAGAIGTSVIDAVVGDLDDAPRTSIAIEAPVYKPAALAPVTEEPKAQSAPAPKEEPAPAAPPAPAAETVIVPPSPKPSAPAPQAESARPAAPISAAMPAPETKPAPSPAAASAPATPVFASAASAPQAMRATRVETVPAEPVPEPEPAIERTAAPKPDPAAAMTQAHIRRETSPAPKTEEPKTEEPKPPAATARPPEAVVAPAETPAPMPAREPAPEATPAREASMSDRERINAAVAQATRKETPPVPAKAPPPPTPDPVDAEEPPPFAARPPDDPGVPDEPSDRAEKPKRRFRLFG